MAKHHYCDRCEANPSTLKNQPHGIEISTLELADATKTGVTIQHKTWDFGRQ